MRLPTTQVLVKLLVPSSLLSLEDQFCYDEARQESNPQFSGSDDEAISTQLRLQR